MKKRIIGSILVAMLLGLTACGNVNQAVIVNNANEVETSVNNNVETEEELEVENSAEADVENTSGASDVTLTGEFKEFTTIDIYGNEVTEDMIKGYDLVMINIWGTFCPPCIAEMPELGELAGELKEQNILLLGVVIDVYDEAGVETAIEIVEDTGADYPHLLVTEDLANIYMSGVSAVPETIFLDSTGTIIGSEVGSRSKADWEAVIATYMD